MAHSDLKTPLTTPPRARNKPLCQDTLFVLNFLASFLTIPSHHRLTFERAEAFACENEPWPLTH